MSSAGGELDTETGIGRLGAFSGGNLPVVWEYYILALSESHAAARGQSNRRTVLIKTFETVYNWCRESSTFKQYCTDLLPSTI
jgi:hypothetical protein